MQIGIIGLGKMGSRMAEKLIKEGHNVSVWNRSPEPRIELQAKFPDAKNLTSSETIKELINSLPSPRIVLLMLPAVEATETTLSEVSLLVEKNDIVIDSGNSY